MPVTEKTYPYLMPFCSYLTMKLGEEGMEKLLKLSAARCAWMAIVVACFAIAMHMITSSYKEWQESPVSTTITTHPITELDFPTVTVCPPRGSNTALNHLLEFSEIAFKFRNQSSCQRTTKDVNLAPLCPHLLLLGGDIEENPGPGQEKKISRDKERTGDKKEEQLPSLEDILKPPSAQEQEKERRLEKMDKEIQMMNLKKALEEEDCRKREEAKKKYEQDRKKYLQELDLLRRQMENGLTREYVQKMVEKNAAHLEAISLGKLPSKKHQEFHDPKMIQKRKELVRTNMSHMLEDEMFNFIMDQIEKMLNLTSQDERDYGLLVLLPHFVISLYSDFHNFPIEEAQRRIEATPDEETVAEIVASSVSPSREKAQGRKGENKAEKQIKTKKLSEQMKQNFAEEKAIPEEKRPFKFSNFFKNEKEKEKLRRGQKKDNVTNETPEEEKRMLEKNMVTKKKQASGIIDITDDKGEEEVEVKVVSDPDREVLCQFPLEMNPNYLLTMGDYKRLEYGRWLNDALVDFYIVVMKLVMLKEEDLQKVYVFDTTFFKRLEDSGVDLKWTRNVETFKKDLVFVPCCCGNHWFLIVVVKPGQVATNGTSIVLLDR